MAIWRGGGGVMMGGHDQWLGDPAHMPFHRRSVRSLAPNSLTISTSVD